jgi:hypothetical protein
MIKIQNSPRAFWITILAISLFVASIAFYQTVPQLRAQDISLWRSKWTALLIALFLNILAGAFAIWGLARGFFDALLQYAETASTSRLARVSAMIVLSAALALFWFIRFKTFGALLPQLFPALWVFLWLSLLATAALKTIAPVSWVMSFAAVVLFQGVLIRSWGIFGAVTDFPFTLEYSETSRFYYASLFFSKSIYGMDLPFSTLHPSRYLLQSIPYIVPGLSLWAHRLWQAFLWLILTGASAWLLARRMKFSSKYMTLLVAFWGFVYFLQGVVYYHLQICVMIILLGVSVNRPWRSLIAVILASLWAGISRVNWFPVPAMLAIAIYLLEKPVSAFPTLRQYLRLPILWAVIGIPSALISQVLYILLSGNANRVSDFGSSFTSNLIWSRLLPNVTYPLGVLGGILIVSAPLLTALVYILKGHLHSLHFIRSLGLFAMLAVLFLGGLMVSTKIGGGGDIHNMDAYMVLLAMIVCSFFAGQVIPETAEQNHWGVVPGWILALAAFIPAAFSVQSAQPRFSYDHIRAQKDLAELEAIVKKAKDQNGEVLFMSERHLLTFDMVDSVTLVPEYEVVSLMEMAMSGNQAYLDRFNHDLANHRFSVIVTRTQRVVKKMDEPFAEENNVWIDSISRPLLCYYERTLTLESSNTLILTPSPFPPGENCP